MTVAPRSPRLRAPLASRHSGPLRRNADWFRCAGGVEATDSDATISDRFKKAADMIPEPYKFTGDVDVSLKLHVNELQELG